MSSIARARRIYEKTGSFSVSEAKTGINRNTLKTWARRYCWRQQRGKEVKPKVNLVVPSKPVGAWMQSLHHESAHFITNGHAACESAQNGARVVAGMTWFPHDGCLRKCQRCMAHAT